MTREVAGYFSGTVSTRTVFSAGNTFSSPGKEGKGETGERRMLMQGIRDAMLVGISKPNGLCSPKEEKPMKIGRTGLGCGVLTRIAVLLPLAMLCGCGGGGDESSSSPPTLSADQAIAESFSLSPKASYTCYWSLPSSGAPVNDNNYFAANFGSEAASPLTNGTQKVTQSALTSIANTLSIPAAASNPTRYLVNGHILVDSKPLYITNISYQGTGVKADTLAVDGITTVTSQLRSNYSVVSLTGTVVSAPAELAHWFSNLYYNPSLLSATATWGAGAAYEKFTATFIGDSYEVTDFSSTTITTGDTPIPAATNTTIATRMNAGGFLVNSDNTTYTMTNGTVSVINGVNTYVATNPRPNQTTTQYRIFFELNGNVYSGALIKNGTVRGGNVYLVAGTNNYSMNYQIRLNKAAVDSLKSAVTF